MPGSPMNRGTGRPPSGGRGEHKEKPRLWRGFKFWDERAQRVIELVPPSERPTPPEVPPAFKKFFQGPRSARERAWRPTLIIRKWPRRLSSVIAGARGDAVKIERELLLCNPLICRVSSAV